MYFTLSKIFIWLIGMKILQSVKLNFNALILNGFTGNEVFMSERYNFIYLQ